MPAFTVFADGPHDVESANARFDRTPTGSTADALPYAKQPVIVRESGTIIGYTGADSVVLDGIDRLEWGSAARSRSERSRLRH